MSAGVSVRSATPLVLTGLPLRIDPDEVLRFQGYKPGPDLPDASLRALFDEALALGERLVEPRAVYRAARVTGQGPDWIEAAGERLTIPAIGRLWGPLAWVGAALCTIGAPLSERVDALVGAGARPLAVTLDSVGSAAVESLAEHVNDLLCHAGLLDGLRVTNRISPGYAGWDAAEQRRLFRLCPGAPAGVTLDEACVMRPAKTISLLVGVGPEARVDHYFTQCRRCWLRGCAHRRAPAATTVHR